MLALVEAATVPVLQACAGRAELQAGGSLERLRCTSWSFEKWNSARPAGPVPSPPRGGAPSPGAGKCCWHRTSPTDLTTVKGEAHAQPAALKSTGAVEIKNMQLCGNIRNNFSLLTY